MEETGAFVDIDGQPVDKKFVMKWSMIYNEDVTILDDNNDNTIRTNVYFEIFLKPDQEDSEKFFQVQNLEFMLTCAVVRALPPSLAGVNTFPIFRKTFFSKNIIFL